MFAERVTADELKSQITFPDLMNYYHFDVGRNQKMLCPFHQENTASFHVYENGGHCYGGCGWSGDIIQFVMDREACYFPEALEKLGQWFGIVKGDPTKIRTVTRSVPKLVHKKKSKEVVNPEIVQYFQEQLQNGHRKWLYDERLLTDNTIEFNRLGWRPDMDGYTIPFWKGFPGLSEVETMQIRYAPKEGRKSRYMTLKGFWYAGLIGRYAINPHFLVLLVGTFDGLLANQDGIPCIAPNGLEVWQKRLDELKWIVGEVEHLFLVPDNTTSEIIESTRLANALGAKLRFMPQMPDYPSGKARKDYTDYRLMGNSPEQFIREVLGMSSTPFITDERHTQTALDILDYMAQDEVGKALELLEILKENCYAWYAVNTKLQFLASQYPEGLRSSEWNDFIRRLEVSHSYESISETIKETALITSCARGEF